jgi:predicted RecB family endonuclease
MSGGYEVVLRTIETAADAAKRASDAVRQVSLAGTLYGIGPGLPGGTSAEAARLLADKWGRAVVGWADNTIEYSDQLNGSLRFYRANEQAAVHDLRASVSHDGARPV